MQWRGTHGEVRFWKLEARGREAAWVGGSCPGRCSLCRGDVVYTTERQIASSPTRKPLARSPSSSSSSPPLFLFPFHFLSPTLSRVPSSRCHSTFALGPSPSACVGSLPPGSLSIACSSFLEPIHPSRSILPSFSNPIVSRLERRACFSLPSVKQYLRPCLTAYSYLAVLRRGSGYAHRLRQRVVVRYVLPRNFSATSRVRAIGCSVDRSEPIRFVVYDVSWLAVRRVTDVISCEFPIKRVRIIRVTKRPEYNSIDKRALYAR